MPADSFHDENPAILEWQLSLVRDARIQMLRVWGAGGGMNSVLKPLIPPRSSSSSRI